MLESELRKTKILDVIIEVILKMVRFLIVFNLSLDETLIFRFKNQISSVVIDIVDSDGANSLEIIQLIFTHMCAMFTNLLKIDELCSFLQNCNASQTLPTHKLKIYIRILTSLFTV